MAEESAKKTIIRPCETEDAFDVFEWSEVRDRYEATYQLTMERIEAAAAAGKVMIIGPGSEAKQVPWSCARRYCVPVPLEAAPVTSAATFFADARANSERVPARRYYNRHRVSRPGELFVYLFSHEEAPPAVDHRPMHIGGKARDPYRIQITGSWELPKGVALVVPTSSDEVARALAHFAGVKPDDYLFLEGAAQLAAEEVVSRVAAADVLRREAEAANSLLTFTVQQQGNDSKRHGHRQRGRVDALIYEACNTPEMRAAWSAELRRLVRATEQERERAERERVVCQSQYDLDEEP